MGVEFGHVIGVGNFIAVIVYFGVYVCLAFIVAVTATDSVALAPTLAVILTLFNPLAFYVDFPVDFAVDLLVDLAITVPIVVDLNSSF